MWQVKEHREVEKRLNKAPNQVKKKYTYWKQLVQEHGPSILRTMPGFHDEALDGEWSGCRSSRLSLKWRVIYGVDADTITIYIEKIGPHNY